MSLNFWGETEQVRDVVPLVFFWKSYHAILVKTVDLFNPLEIGFPSFWMLSLSPCGYHSTVQYFQTNTWGFKQSLNKYLHVYLFKITFYVKKNTNPSHLKGDALGGPTARVALTCFPCVGAPLFFSAPVWFILKSNMLILLSKGILFNTVLKILAFSNFHSHTHLMGNTHTQSSPTYRFECSKPIRVARYSQVRLGTKSCKHSQRHAGGCRYKSVPKRAFSLCLSCFEMYNPLMSQ